MLALVTLIATLNADPSEATITFEGDLDGWVSATQVPANATSWTAIRHLYHEETR